MDFNIENEPVVVSETDNKTNSQAGVTNQDTNNKENDDLTHSAPIQNVKQSESVSSPAPTLNVTPNQDYIIYKKQTSPFLIIIIIVLLLVIVVLSSMFFIMSRNDKTDTSGENPTVMDDVKITAEFPTESETKTTTTVTTEPVKTTTQTTISDQYTSYEISDMFSAYISENPDPNRTYENSDYGYALFDLNNDGTQELIITEGEKEKGSPWIIGVYNIQNSKLSLLIGFDTRFPGSLCEDNIISYYSSLGQGGGTVFYKYTSGESLDLVDMISYDYSSGTKVMYHNSDVITEAESHSILENYKPIQFEPKPLKINIQPTTYATIETYAFYGIVDTESDSLNLRDKPSTNSNVIEQLPKGTKASVYYVDGYPDWYKIYTDNGYEGYVAAQYIKEYNESSNNNGTPYISGTQTPWGTFTYSNYNSFKYSSINLYSASDVGIDLYCDLEEFNSQDEDFRIDNVAFVIYKENYNDKPHNYNLELIISGTVLNKSSKGQIWATLINDKTGDEELEIYDLYSANLYENETFCFDGVSESYIGNFDVWDNSSYTLVLK